VHGPKVWQPRLEAGQRLRFRLRASPTKRVALPREDPKRGHQRRGLLTRLEQAGWLARQGERCGFALCGPPAGWFDAFGGAEPDVAVQITALGHLKGHKPPSEAGGACTVTHLAVDFDGLLRVTDPAALAAAVAAGIGPGKGFGLGLLSLARAD
jgi:CRISPR system Cascade subunit CasE